VDSSITEKSTSAHGFSAVTPSTSICKVQSPAPGVVFDEAAIELGGLGRKIFNNGIDIKSEEEVRILEIRAHIDDGEPPSLTPLSVVHTPSSPGLGTIIKAAKAFALVSAIVRTRAMSYLAPCPAWAREGIGTRSWTC
jgi:hypothetical protein